MKVVTSGKYVNLATRAGWEFVERKNICGIVGIVAVTDAGKLLLIEQYRPPMDKVVFELPAGLAGDIKGSESEDLAIAARRELLEKPDMKLTGRWYPPRSTALSWLALPMK